MAAKAKAIGVGVALIVTGSLATNAAYGHSVRQKVGGYEGNDGKQRRQVALGMSLDGKTSGVLSATSFSVDVKEDASDQAALEDTDARRNKRHVLDVSFTQTWNKLTETSIIGSAEVNRTQLVDPAEEEDAETLSKNRTLGIGIKRWFHHETFRVSFDVSRSILEQPYQEFLDYDSEVLTPPVEGESTGLTMGLRHLASPTTILDYTTSYIAQDGRPPAYGGGVAVRQFIPAFDGACHVAASRVVNRGDIGTETLYGQVDAWMADTAYLQNLWSGARSRVGYRYYRELEVTRAYEDLVQRGTDAVSLGFAQDIDNKDIWPAPMTIEASGTRILTNSDVMASTFEMGLTTRL